MLEDEGSFGGSLMEGWAWADGREGWSAGLDADVRIGMLCLLEVDIITNDFFSSFVNWI